MDIDYNAVFGLDDAGEEVTEPAELSEVEDVEGAEGAEVQEVAEPAEGPEEPAEPEEEEAQVEETKPEQTPEERARFAAERRRRETQAAIDEAVFAALQEERRRADADLANFFAAAGLKNTITGEPITNMQQFNVWKQAFDAEKLQRDLKAGKLTPEALNGLIAENPVIRQAEEIMRQAEAERTQRQAQSAQAKIDADLAEIQKLNPAIHDVRDLMAMPNAQQFYDYVKRGNSFLDAYYLANRESLQNRAAEAAKQQAVNRSRSKDHMTPTRSRGQGDVSVPAEVKAAYLELIPGASAEEIQKHYNKYLKG